MTADARRARGLLGHAVMAALCVVTLVPIVWMLLAAVRPADAALGSPLSGPLTTDSLRAALHVLPVGRLFVNTGLMALGIAAGQLLTSLLAAYAFTTWRFAGRKALFVLVVASWMVPFQVTMLPNYVLLSHLGLLHTLPGVIVPQLSSAFALLMLRQHIKAFPRELLDAASVDGRSSWSVLWTVVVPNLRPALIALAILLFVGAWNEYFWPLLVFRSDASVLQLGISELLNRDTVDYGALMAISTLATVPVLIFYAVLNRRVVNAFVRSGLR